MLYVPIGIPTGLYRPLTFYYTIINPGFGLFLSHFIVNTPKKE